MIEVRFIRHAKGTHMVASELIAGRSIDAVLTDEGREEAAAKGRELKARNILPDRIVSSSAVRCIQTGQLILRAMGLDLPIQHTDDLLEMDQGNFVGRIRSEVYTPQVQGQITELGKDFALPGGESMNQVGVRGLGWLEREAENASNESRSILAIAHAGLITHTVGQIENWDQPRSLTMLRSMPPVSLIKMVVDGRGSNG
jgi:broad specificity phosphatase PhoE